MSDGMSDDSAQDDRRREARAPIELKVEYKRLNTFFYDYTKNISKGGTFIKTEKPLDIGTIFLFKLMLPMQVEPLALRGEVRWVVKEGEPLPPQVPAGHEPGMGIKFVYDSPDQRRDLELIVERMMIDSLGPLIYQRLVKQMAIPVPAPRPLRTKTKPRIKTKS
jgi:type IV pilus assembly protein PilZ